MTNITFPKLSDLINVSEPLNWTRMFTYAWTDIFGLWFFAMVVGVIGGALYMKYDNALGTFVWFIVMGIFLGSIINAGILYIFGILCMFILGFLLYRVFINKRG